MFSDASVGFKVTTGAGLKNTTKSGVKLKFNVGLHYGDDGLANGYKSWQAFSVIGREFGLGGTGLFNEVKSTNSSTAYNYGISLGLSPSIGVGSPSISGGTQFNGVSDVTPYSDFTNWGLWIHRFQRILRE